MKYHGITKVLVPWYDTAGFKQRSLLRIDGTIDKRKLLQGLQKFVLENFQKKVSKSWILKNCPIINDNGTTVSMVSHDTAVADDLGPEIEAFLQRLQDAPDDSTDTSSTPSDAKATGESLSDLPSKD